MCGIGGFLPSATASPREELESRLWAMIATLRHRGPDDEGIWTDERAGLAHARLSITDLSRAYLSSGRSDGKSQCCERGCGLEARSPLLDHVLMDWAAGIPAELRMARGVTKALFKSVMEPYLPPELLYRPKMGFSPPVDQWIRNNLKELDFDTLLSQTATERGLFRREYVQRLLDEHSGFVRDHHPRPLGAPNARALVSNVDRCAKKARNLLSGERAAITRAGQTHTVSLELGRAFSLVNRKRAPLRADSKPLGAARSGSGRSYGRARGTSARAG
jgi:asparagine synthetase B (glutamine-hydrolysing)